MSDEERERDDSSETRSWIDVLREAPPWRDVLPSGKLGPKYGPATESSYERAIADWAESYGAINSGGLWDPEVAASMTTRRIKMAPPRPEAADAIRFLQSPAVESLPPRQAQACVWYYIEGRSQGRIATDLGIKISSVLTMIKRFRQKLRAGQPSQASK